MKKLSLYQVLYTFLGVLLVWASLGIGAALSFLLGCFAIGFVFLTWGIGLHFIFQKKFVALSISIIVFKYAILGVIIYWLVQQGWLQEIWFAMGIASFMMTALTYAILENLKEDKQDVI